MYKDPPRFSKGNLRFLTILFLIIWYILLHISWLKETKYTLQICEEILNEKQKFLMTGPLTGSKKQC